ncbi:hypothetical protein TNCV_3064121 [Trichonephila clavipes]|nr:hypothetical protein TNCV_3064121 [Trichonephila clavipes]
MDEDRITKKYSIPNQLAYEEMEGRKLACEKAFLKRPRPTLGCRAIHIYHSRSKKSSSSYSWTINILGTLHPICFSKGVNNKGTQRADTFDI